MKKNWIVFLIILLSLPTIIQAQKFGYVDTNFILSKMDSYKEIEAEMDKIGQEWETQIDAKWQEIQQLKQDLQTEEILLTDDMKEQRETYIKLKEQEAREFQRNIFGYEGLYYKKRIELMKPVQDELYEAIATVSRKKKLQIMFDKSGELIMVYHEPTHDYTEYVLEELGISQTNTQE